MSPDAYVLGMHKQLLQFYNVVIETFGSPPIRPVHDNVLRMALFQSGPIAMRQNLKIQCFQVTRPLVDLSPLGAEFLCA